MALHLRRPDDGYRRRLLGRCRSAELTYAPVGGSLDGDGPPGMQRREWIVRLDGEGAFDRAVAALRSWSVHRGSGLDVLTDGELAVGTNVALTAPLPVGFVDAACRVVALVEQPDRFGFSYGTLPEHPECGEESFVVSRESGVVAFAIVAVSRPAHRVARLVPAVADRLQASAARRYLDAMRDACS